MLQNEVNALLLPRLGELPLSYTGDVFLTIFALRNPIAITLFYVCIVAIGLLAMAQMGRSILPPVALPVVTVAAPYPGAGANEIERLVIEPIEDQLETLPDLDRVSASAQDGTALISVRFRFGSNLEVDRTNVQQALDSARSNMPADLIPPLASKSDPSQAPIVEESVSSAILSPGALSTVVDREIVPRLRATSGVGTVLESGALRRQLTIAPEPPAMNALGATVLDIFNAASRSNDLLPGGRLRTSLKDSSIGIDAAALSAQALKEVPVSVGTGQAVVPLGDLALVFDGYAEQTVLSRVDGDAAIVLYAAHRQDSDSLKTIDSTRRTFAQLANQYPLIRFQTLRTDAPYTNAAVDGVLQTLGEGIVLTVLVMLMFLHAWRNAAIAAIAIPTSLCAAFAAMWAAGFTINILSLMGLSLTIGILVDDSIVIIEAITRNAHQLRALIGPFERDATSGNFGDKAALAGRRELGSAAIAITLVDVAVFMPIALMSGLVGEFMREFGMVIVFATAFSLLVSLTLTPLLAARWALRSQTPSLDEQAKSFPWMFRTRLAMSLIRSWHAIIARFNQVQEHLAQQYAGIWLCAALRNGRLIGSVATVLCVLAMVPVFNGAIPTEFSPPTNKGEVTLDLTFPPGTPLAATDAGARSISSAALDDPAVKHVITTAGRAFNGTSDIFAGNVAEIGLVLADPTAAGDDVIELVKSLQRLVPDASIAGAGRGMGGTAQVSYSIAGDPGAIDIAATRLASALRASPYATDVRTSDGGLGPRLQISIDPNKALMLGVKTDDAAQVARIATGGAIAFKARLPSGLVDVVVRTDGAESGDVEAIANLTIRNSHSVLVPLHDVSNLTRSTEPVVIERENRDRVVTVTANTVGNAPIGLVTTPMRGLLADQSILLPGTRIAPRGDVEQFFDTVGKMFGALGLSVLVVYGILAMLYKSYTLPLVIMISVPLAAIGAFGSLYMLNALKPIFPNLPLLHGQTLNLYSMLGIIMLVGLVAKNGILLVEYAERELRAGRDAVTAIRLAASRRFRPIAMTTFAMIAGMLPLALGDTIGAEYRKALGTVVIGGLSSSLLLTLFVVPVAYVAWRSRRSHGSSQRTIKP